VITVVHLITKLELGGAQENTLDTCRGLDRNRFRVALIHGPGGILDQDARTMKDVQVIEMPELVRSVNPMADVTCLLRLIQELRRLRAEHARLSFDEKHFIVHTHSSKAGVVGRLAAHRAGVPRIVHSIHGFGFHEGQHPLKYHLFLNVERAAARMTHAFVGVSRANLAEARAKGIITSHHRVELVRSGMDLSAFENLDARRSEVRAALDLSPEDEAIVSIGNFKPQKDPLTMVEAMRILAMERPRAVLLLAGDGSLRAEVEDAIARANLGSTIRLLGWRRDVPDLLAAADVVALSSIFEGLPRSAVQAVAARRPFVGTRVDGTSEIIHDGKNGYLVPPRSPEALAKALSLALAVRPIDPADQRRISEWGAEQMVRRLEALYLELVVG
jgi:glycosyltransferase involved in cell wall biosynthesis